jgi:Flp pilus assembly protein TadG
MLRSERHAGQALAEWALVFPIVAVLLVGAFDIGRGVFAYNSVTNAAREGARLAIVNQDTNLIAQRVISQTAIAETAAPNVTVSFYQPTPNADPAQNAVCSSPISVGCVAVVRYETTFQPITPIIRNILFANGVTLVATSIETVEFTCPSAAIPVSTNCPKQP